MPGGPLPGIPVVFESFLSSDNYSDLIPAERNCTHGISWIWVVMGQCVMDVRGIFALIAGVVCIITWIVTGVPQVIENCRTGLPDKAISPLLLTFWTLGDVSNFLGCILAHQLILQVVVSAYSIANDLVLVFQFIYYKIRHQVLIEKVTEALGDGQILPVDSTNVNHMHSHLVEESSHEIHSDSPGILRSIPTQRLAVCCLCIMSFAVSHQILGTSQYIRSSRSQKGEFIDMRTRPSRQLLQWDEVSSPITINKQVHSSILDDQQFKIGYTFGWISSICYLCSRFPQMFQNWKRKSTEGLCLVMFCFTILGNSSYGLQIFLTSLEPSYLLRSCPWLVGSLGIIAMDLIILFQFYYYSRRNSRSRRTSLLEDTNPDDSVHEPLLNQATLSKREACETWRARDRLFSSLLAIFPAALIGQYVTITLLNETRVTGRLCSCDGMLNLELDGDVVIRTPNLGQTDSLTYVKSLTIFGRRIRYISLPSSIDVYQNLQIWDGKRSLSKRIIPRPTRAVDKYAYLRQPSTDKREHLQELTNHSCTHLHSKNS